jgi:lipopolysaccharide assembly outer membrane protein LptD (OstA)
MNKFMSHRKNVFVLLVLSIILFSANVFAAPLKLMKGDGINQIDAAADRYEYIGDNVVATGNVVIRMKDLQLTADKAVINSVSQDLEMVGNVTFRFSSSKCLPLLSKNMNS